MSETDARWARRALRVNAVLFIIAVLASVAGQQVAAFFVACDSSIQTSAAPVDRRGDVVQPVHSDFTGSVQCGDFPHVIGVGTGSGHADFSLPTAPPSAQSTPIGMPANGQVAFGTYRNVFPNDLSSVAAYEQAVGKTMTIVHWYALWGGWKGAFDRSDLEVVGRRGSVPMVTWEPWAGVPSDPAWSLRAAILSGRSDAYIEGWARGLAAYARPVLLRFAHEMHDKPDYPWGVGQVGNTADDYVAAWRHVRAIFDRNGATNVAWVWNPNTMGDTTAATYAPIYRGLYPGDEYVDWVGLDIYNTGPNVDWRAPYWRPFAAILSEPYAAITGLTNKPLVLGEVGSAEVGGDKARWIADGLGPSLTSQFPRVKAIVWFDVTKEENWTVESSEGAYGAFCAALRQPHFMPNGAGLVSMPRPATGGMTTP